MLLCLNDNTKCSKRNVTCMYEIKCLIFPECTLTVVYFLQTFCIFPPDIFSVSRDALTTVFSPFNPISLRKAKIAILSFLSAMFDITVFFF